jgi:D-sedoheptulose 7-phosphate isomerase
LETRRNRNTIFFIGNGGSAATASHFANDLQIGTRSPDLPFKAISLSDNQAIITAVGNDFGYEEIFSKQLEALMEKGDLLVAISASGNSPNIVKGCLVAKQKSCLVVGLTGFDGGQLKKLSNLNIHIPSQKGEYGPVEDLHMIVNHLIGSYLNREIIREQKIPGELKRPSSSLQI